MKRSKSYENELVCEGLKSEKHKTNKQKTQTNERDWN